MSKAKQCDIFGTRTLPWACRITEYGKAVSILGTKENDQIVVNSSTRSFVINQVQRIVGTKYNAVDFQFSFLIIYDALAPLLYVWDVLGLGRNNPV